MWNRKRVEAGFVSVAFNLILSVVPIELYVSGKPMAFKLASRAVVLTIVARDVPGDPFPS